METINNLEEKKPKLSIGFFFLSLGLLITLITSVVSFLNLVFGTLDVRFPDVLNATYQYGYSTASFEGIRVALAILIIFFPVFIIVSYFWKRFIKKGLARVDEIIRKWMIYIILFLSSLVIAIDLVTLVRYFVSGEITSRFVYKVLAAFVVAVLIGKYYLFSEIWSGSGKLKKLVNLITPILSVVLVLGAIIYSFSIIGSPAKQRALRLDDQRVSNLQSIQYQVINYWQQKEQLPADLKTLANPLSGFSVPVDPEFQKGNVYEYAIKDKTKLSFELCATFSLPMPKGWVGSSSNRGIITPMPAKTGGVSYPAVPGGGVNDSWNHGVGRTCFERTIDKDLYPPYPKVLKNN